MLRAQCLSRRIPDRTTLEHEIAAWELQRNESGARITWFFDPDRALHRVIVPMALFRGDGAEVADQLVARFDGVASRVGFYFPYAIADDLIAELVSSVRERVSRST